MKNITTLSIHTDNNIPPDTFTDETKEKIRIIIDRYLTSINTEYKQICIWYSSKNYKLIITIKCEYLIDYKKCYDILDNLLKILKDIILSSKFVHVAQKKYTV